MVIELTDSLLSCPIEQEDLLVRCVSNILIGYYEGNHLLTASDDIIDYFRSRIQSDRELRALSYLYANNSYDYDVLWSVKVVLSELPDVTAHELCYKFFDSTMSVQPCILLSEDLDDVRFYYLLAKEKYGDGYMSYFPYSGGGGNTAKCIDTLKRYNVLCLAIIDSDVKYPGGKDGNTCTDALKQMRKPLSNMHVEKLQLHEIENLVPFPFLLKKATKQRKLFLSRLQKKNHLEYLAYFDIKDGISKEQVESDSSYYDYAENLYNIVYGKRGGDFRTFLNSKHPEQKLFEGIDGGILSKFLEQSKEKRIFECRSYQTAAWNRIQDIVFAFTCCRGDDPIQ